MRCPKILSALLASSLVMGLALAFSLGCQSLDPLPNSTMDSNPADSNAARIAVLEDQQAAWNAGDLEAFMTRGYWPSAELTFLSGDSWTTGYETVLARYRKNYQEGDAEMGTLTFSELESVPISPDAGLVKGRWHVQMSDGKAPHGLFTLLMRKLDGRWLVVHDHTSSAE